MLMVLEKLEEKNCTMPLTPLRFHVNKLKY
uniref:Uncharacterized protein n=1 Tax=Arundo donax TaxID=35708 RepID=A0A0A9E847_ARUDO